MPPAARSPTLFVYYCHRAESRRLVAGAAAAVLPLLLARRSDYHAPVRSPPHRCCRDRRSRGVRASIRAACTATPSGPSSATVPASCGSAPTTDATGARAPFERGSSEDLTQLRGAARGRNVVLVILESTAARYLGLHGARPDPMPGLTGLAATRWSSSTRMPSIPKASRDCSRRSARATRLRHAAGDLCLGPVCVACRPAAASGYATALFHSGRFDYLGMRATSTAAASTRSKTPARLAVTSVELRRRRASTVERMLTWIDARGTAPFLLTYLPIAGHHPYAAPRIRDRSKARAISIAIATPCTRATRRWPTRRGLERGLDDRTLLWSFRATTAKRSISTRATSRTRCTRSKRTCASRTSSPRRVYRGPHADSRRERCRHGAHDPRPPRPGRSRRIPGVVAAGASPPDGALLHRLLAAGWASRMAAGNTCGGRAGRSTLYDVCRDPDETRDLAGDFESRVRTYRGRVQRWASAQQDAVQRGR